MSEIQFEEEEFSTKFDGKTLLRILTTIKPYWRGTLGFLFSVAMV